MALFYVNPDAAIVYDFRPKNLGKIMENNN